MTAVPTCPDALSMCPIPRPRRWEWSDAVSQRSDSTSSDRSSRLSRQRPHRLVDAVKDPLARQDIMDPEAFEGVLGAQRFQPGDRDRDAGGIAGLDQVTQRLRGGE